MYSILVGILVSSTHPAKCINTTTKNEFLQCLIHNEIIHKRLGAFCQGLESLKVYSLLKQYAGLMKPVFLCLGHQPLTSDGFLNLISTPKPRDETEMVTYNWFVKYVKANQDKLPWRNCSSFVLLKCILPMGHITIKFLSSSPLPMAKACFAVTGKMDLVCDGIECI